jgi:hypothetical protein
MKQPGFDALSAVLFGWLPGAKCYTVTTVERANAWYQRGPWLVGSNFIPATAMNELDMWRASTFDPTEIDKELGCTEALGMNTMRVFLHALLWEQDAAGFKQRIDAFLTTSARGPQHPTIPGVHNSGWVQSPGATALQDRAQFQLPL